MAELARRLPEGARGLCALTFDDGAHDRVPELLARLGVPGTLYVCPGLARRADTRSSPRRRACG